jgi:hypothetical protein
MIDQKQLENVESCKYLGSILTNDGGCTCEIKCNIAMAKAAFNKKRALFTGTCTEKTQAILKVKNVLLLSVNCVTARTITALQYVTKCPQDGSAKQHSNIALCPLLAALIHVTLRHVIHPLFSASLFAT